MNSLRFRLLIAAVVGVGLALLLLDLVVVEKFTNYAESEFYDDLEDIAQEIITSFPVDPKMAPTINLLRPQFSRLNSGYYWQADDSGGLLMRSPSLGDLTIQAPADDIQLGAIHHHRLRGPDGASILVVEELKLLSGYARPLRILVGINAQQVDLSKRSFRNILVWASVGLGITLVLAAALQTWIGLRPLQVLHDRLLLVRDGKANRLEGDFPIEVAPLVEDLNALLVHQAEVVERGRVMAGNLAHGLKTPLAVIANEAALMVLDGQKSSSGTIQAQISRMQRMVDYHTARARAAAAKNVPGMRCEVLSAISSLKRVIERLHAQRALRIELDIEDGAVFKGDRQDLDEMMGNLLDNAAKWTREQVVVGCRLDGGYIEITVDDDGPGLPETLYDEAFARGRRLDEAVPGSGLGLAIVRDLAEMYGGQVKLERSQLNGFRVSLRLPGDRQR